MATSLRHRLAALAFVLILAVQCIVPIVQLRQARPAHFGWQMFCDWKPIPRYWIVRANGAADEVDVAAHIGVRRLDADYSRVLPRFLLETYPDAVAVRWQWPGSDVIEELACDR